MPLIEEHPEQSSIVAHIDASSVDTGMEARDAHLRSPDFLLLAAAPVVFAVVTRGSPS
jgi:polyisoprenoid-binding protein YceI